MECISLSSVRRRSDLLPSLSLSLFCSNALSIEDTSADALEQLK